MRRSISVSYTHLLSHEPVDLLILMLGTNDTKERFSVSPECIVQGLRRVVEKAANAGCWRGGKSNILIVTPQNIGREYAKTACAATMGRGCAEKSEQLAPLYQALAEEMGCHYLDANRVVKDGPNHVDYMHLTETGHAQLSEALAELVPQLVK